MNVNICDKEKKMYNCDYFLLKAAILNIEGKEKVLDVSVTKNT